MRKGRFAALGSASEAVEEESGFRRILGFALAVLAPAAVAATVLIGVDLPAAIPAGFGMLLACSALVLLRAELRSRPARISPDGERARTLVADFEESGSGWFWETDADGQLAYVSEPLARAIGRDHDALIGRRFEELLLVEQAEDPASDLPTVGFHLNSRFPFANVIVAPDGDKDLCWSLSGRPRFDEVGRFLGFRGIGVAISERERAEILSTRAAGCDSLTGLANRARMRAMLEEALGNSAVRREGCALLLIDLDRFKQVNDTLGHPIGDLLLREAAERLREMVDEGQVGRLGGDEFEALLPGVDEEGRLAALCEQIIARISAPYVIRGHTISIGASIGIAISRPGKTLADSLIKQADLALYAAKGAGRGTYRFFAPEMDLQETERRILENDLRLAISKGQLRLAFQPIVDAASEDLVGFEALLRWSHPVRGLLAPADFLALAEASGLIAGIGEWVVREACEQASEWPAHVRLVVNLSPVELEQAQFPAIVAGALGASELDPERLELDLSETALLADTETVRSVLTALKGLGVRLALDDFGLGSASLHTLQAAAVDRLKIHPSLLRTALHPDSRGRAVLGGIVGLAETLKMGIIAEGVETLDELNLVRELGCTEIQGFLCGRPMTGEEALKLARDSLPISVADVQPRPARHSLLRRGSLRWGGSTVPVRLRNISADGAMIESGDAMEPGCEVEIDFDGVKLVGQVRWAQEGRIGLKFSEAFDLNRLGSARRNAKPGVLRPDYLRSELDPDSPWAGRQDRLTIRDVKRK